MKKLLFILLFGFLYSNIAIPDANSFSLNKNDRFGCTADAGGYAITIKKKFSDNYFAIENKIRGRKDLGFARFTGDSLESFWIDDETNDLKVHLLTPEDDKYTDWWFLVSLTKEEIESLAQYKSFFYVGKGRNYLPIFTEEQLQNEIDIHSSRLSIISEIMNSKEKLEKQGLITVTSKCKKSN